MDEVVCPDGRAPLRKGDQQAVCLGLDPAVGFERPMGPFVVYVPGPTVYGDRVEGGARITCDEADLRAVERAVYVPCEAEGFCACLEGCWDTAGLPTSCRRVNGPECAGNF